MEIIPTNKYVNWLCIALLSQLEIVKQTVIVFHVE